MPDATEKARERETAALAAIYRRALERRRAALERADREGEAAEAQEEVASSKSRKP